MAIVKYKNQSGVTYAYESTSKWDPEKKQARPVRKYLGRVDPETGEIIPTAGKRGRPRKDSNVPVGETDGTDYKALYQKTEDALRKSNAEVTRLEMENAELLHRNTRLEKLVSSILQQVKAVVTDE